MSELQKLKALVRAQDQTALRLRSLLAQREQLLSDAQFRVADMEKSLSWKLTAPLRSLGRAFVKQ